MNMMVKTLTFDIKMLETEQVTRIKTSATAHGRIARLCCITGKSVSTHFRTAHHGDMVSAA